MRTCLITGANSGIGRVMALEVARTGANVVMVCRNQEKAQAAADSITETTGNENVEIMIADLSSIEQIRRAAREFLDSHDRLDILINNAGAVLGKRILTADGLETTFALNHLSYFLLTNLVLDTLEKTGGARIVSVSSGAHESAKLDFDDLQMEKRYSAIRQYCNSKLMNLLFTYELARRLEGTGVTANAMHPGGVRTGFSREGGFVMKLAFFVYRPFLITPEQGADTGVYLALDEDAAPFHGQYFYKRKPVQSTAASHDRDSQRRLWEISEELTALEA